MICRDVHVRPYAWADRASPQHGLSENFPRNTFSRSIIIVDPNEVQYDVVFNAGALLAHSLFIMVISLKDYNV